MFSCFCLFRRAQGTAATRATGHETCLYNIHSTANWLLFCGRPPGRRFGWVRKGTLIWRCCCCCCFSAMPLTSLLPLLLYRTPKIFDHWMNTSEVKWDSNRRCVDVQLIYRWWMTKKHVMLKLVSGWIAIIRNRANADFAALAQKAIGPKASPSVSSARIHLSMLCSVRWYEDVVVVSRTWRRFGFCTRTHVFDAFFHSHMCFCGHLIHVDEFFGVGPSRYGCRSPRYSHSFFSSRAEETGF